MAVTGSAFLDFVIGFVVSLIASIMNAAGLNLLKLDHVRNSALAPERQRNECGRPMWHVGLYLYIASQLAGSTIALNFLKTQWVAPLGSIALIFNFVFAKILVGTQITRNDVYGTIVVMLSVVWIVVFGGMNSGGDIEETLTLPDLKALFSRVVFTIYFSILNGVIFAFLALGVYAYWAISLDDESGQMRKRMKTKLTHLLGTNRFARASGLTLEGDEGLEAEARDLRLKKVVAMIMSACGGLLASETLLLAKSGVKLITSTFAGNNQFTDYLSYFILFVLVFTAILQVYCLNTGLKLYDSVLVVPTFYGFYTAFGLINSTIYLNQLGDYEPWVLLLVLVGIVVLIYGVRMLSAPKPEHLPSGGQLSAMDIVYDDDEEDEHEIGQGSKGGELPTGSGGKGSRKSKMSLRKKKSTKRQSQHGPMGDEENDAPSMYGSQRGILDDVSSEISSTINGGGRSVGGGSSTRERGLSFASKSSFQSDPFRTPKDGRSIHDGFIGTAALPLAMAGHRRSAFFVGQQDDGQAPTHVLVDTTIDLNDSEDDTKADGHNVRERERERRRQSMLQSSLKSLTMPERQASANMNIQRPRVDTAAAKARRESARFSSSSGIMSPSQFKAHLTNSAQQHQQQQQSSSTSQYPFQSDQDEVDELSAIPSAIKFKDMATSGQPWQRGHSARWSTGSSKIDQAFEDLNPFKVLKGHGAGGHAGMASSSTTRTLEGASCSLPSSPHPGSSTGGGPLERSGQHGRQDSFTGLPSEWDVPGRKKRHSMRFGDAAKSSSASGGLGSSSSSTTPSSPANSETGAGPSMPSTPTRSHSSGGGVGNGVSVKPFFGPGEWVPSPPAQQPGGGFGELGFAPSPRTSRIMSSPEIQLGPVFALAAAAEAAENQDNRENGKKSDYGTGTGHKDHYFTGVSSQPPSAAAPLA
ncbi:hypothetical protein EDD11_005155 [Mortierella claussenii]|nr:hypothetical protein EDD11_005155 [Mortierella claussenii]